MKSLLAITFALLLGPAGVAPAETTDALLLKHCSACHNPEESLGQLDLVTLLKQTPLVRNTPTWRVVMDRIEGGEMPPDGEPKPSREERQALLTQLTRAIDQFDYSQIDNPGYEPTRRLSNIEYDNTVSDLFGLKLRPSSKFPTDLSGKSGFDNSANTLFLQPQLFERFVHAADEISNEVLSEANSHLHNKLHINLRDDARVTPAPFFETFLSRAFRRPVTENEKAKYRELFIAVYSQTNDRRLAYKRLIDTVLISPQFLFKTESLSGKQESYRIGQFELANRLSYFLWASMPDEELFELAKQKKLFDQAVLNEQVQRMLNSPKADTLGSVFGGQWLGFQHLGTRIRMDPIDNPWCTESLMSAMRQETAMLLSHTIRHNKPATELLLADYTFLNEELAQHYRIPNILGDHLRRVELTSPHRGGLLGQGSLHAVTSFPGRTSPIVRGNWVLTTILGTPPPPPPPGAAEFEPAVERRRDLSTAEKLALHRDNPRCASCHDQIDPLGIALENFDFFGRYQTRSRGKPIVAKAQLPDGTSFEGPAGLKLAIVEAYHEEFIRQLSSRLLSYGLGRQLEYFDEPAIRKIYRDLETDDFRLHTLINSIITSYPFQHKRLPQASIDEVREEPGLNRNN